MKDYLEFPLNDIQVDQVEHEIDKIHPLKKTVTIEQLFPFLKPFTQLCNRQKARLSSDQQAVEY